MILVNDCSLCNGAEESSNHVLLWCPTVYKLWSVVYGVPGIKWVVAGSAGGELGDWKFLKETCMFADMIPLSIMWFVWKEMNSRTFEGVDDVNVIMFLRIDDLRPLIFCCWVTLHW